MTTTLLTSYEDKNTNSASSIIKIGADTKAGLHNCAKETREFGKEKDKNPQPENTRSKPADRIWRFCESISWPTEDERESVRNSTAYKKSASFLIKCVLASVYGEEVKIEPLDIAELLKESSYPGRQYFVNSILGALNMGDDRINCLRRREGGEWKLIGLLSKNGPIPVVEDVFSLEDLQLDETKSIESLIHDLSDQDKKLLLFWLKNPDVKDQQCKLYSDISEILEIKEKIASAPEDFADLNQVLKASGLTAFPTTIDNSNAVLQSRVCLFPIRDKEAPFGYGFTKPLTIDTMDGLCYVFLLPFTKEIVNKINSPDFDFSITSIECRNPQFENKKLVSVTIGCVIKNKGLTIRASKPYSSSQIRYIKCFPSLTIYGPVPKYGWIARRDLELAGDYPSPLLSGSTENISLKDIQFDANPFEQTGENYTVYRGEIPQWLGINVNGVDWLGGIPLRIPSPASEKDWITNPNFIQLNPPTGTMIVAADIGSSRSAILFQKSGDTVIDETFIKNDQPLGITITSFGSVDDNAKFGMMFFLPEKQISEIKGKTPIGLLTTNKYQNQTSDDVALYESGKLIMLDPKSIADVSTRKILSDIKVGADKKAMALFARGMLTRIVDRAVHLGCSTIDLRLSYLVERYSPFRIAWQSAIEKFKDVFPDIKITLNMFLPESLSIANWLKSQDEFQTTSGAAIIDVGDFTTDFALFEKQGNQILPKGNESILFAGRQIIIQPVWDYLLFSGTKIADLFKADSNETKQAVSRLESARTEALKKSKKGTVPEDVRRDILCLMPIRQDKIRPSLQNLFDICYLTEIVLLKRLLQGIEKRAGSFDIHLFGGGSSLMKSETAGYNWGTVLGRICKTQNRSGDGKALAEGLLNGEYAENEETGQLELQPHKDLRAAAKEEKEKAINYSHDDQQHGNVKLSADELHSGYIRFLKNAQALKKWQVLDSNDNNVSAGKIFNVKKPGKNLDGEIEDSDLYARIYDEALEYATSGSVTDPAIIKVLFAYKMAYQSAVAFYSKGRK